MFDAFEVGATDACAVGQETGGCAGDAVAPGELAACIGTKVSHFVLIELTDTYTPPYVQWGMGSAIDYHVNRYVMVKQS